MSATQTQQLLQAYQVFFPKGLVGSYVSGEMIPGDGSEISLINPATGDVYLKYHDASESITQQACIAAMAGQQSPTAHREAETAKAHRG